MNQNNKQLINQTNETPIMTKILLDNVISATKALKGSKLETLTSIEPVMENIKQLTGLDTIEEVMMLVAIFDRQCADEESTIFDLADYFCCSSMEIMSFVPALQSLQSKGFIKASNSNDNRRKTFYIYNNVFNAIVEGKEIKPISTESATSVDQFTFCYMVHDILKDREHGQISTKELYAEVEQLEEEHSSLEMVKEMKENFADTDTRVWYYEMCRDFSLDYKGRSTSINATLRDIYDNVAQGSSVKNSILNESHPLIKENFGELCTNDNDNSCIDICLTEKGIRLLYGASADAYIKKTRCENKYEFLNKIEDLFGDYYPHRISSMEFRHIFTEFQRIEKANQHLSAVTNAQKVINDVHDRFLYYRVCTALVDSNVFHLEQISEAYRTSMQMEIKLQLKNKQHLLQKQGLVEIKGTNFFEKASIVLTNKGKELFLEEDVDLFEEKIADEDIIAPAEIVEKQLFFEPTLEKQLSILKESLDETKLSSIRERLKANNLPTGVAALLYGEPGTGKTESVLQIARSTGRAIMHVDISQTKSCWFGDSEKIIKGVFNKYRKLCKKSKVKPILLFNEADAVFSKRKDANSSTVAQTENAIQNIILEEMENLEGILIATTNLADNLDSAFERRFLFKVRFGKPTIDSKKLIWKNKMPHLFDEEAMELAASFDFSGGEIDNIVRKATMEEVLNGATPNMERIKTICLQEKISTSSKKTVGF